MIPRRIAGATRYLGAPLDWKPELDGKCGHLAIRTIGAPEAGKGFCESAWEPTPAELEVISKGGSIVLRVYGWQPPVALYVEQRLGEFATEYRSKAVERVEQHPDLTQATNCPACDMDVGPLVRFCQNRGCPYRG